MARDRLGSKLRFVFAAIVAVSTLSGVAVAIATAPPSGLLSPDRYNSLYTFHAAMMWILLPLLLVIVRRRDLETHAPFWALAAACIVGGPVAGMLTVDSVGVSGGGIIAAGIGSLVLAAAAMLQDDVPFASRACRAFGLAWVGQALVLLGAGYVLSIDALSTLPYWVHEFLPHVPDSVVLLQLPAWTTPIVIAAASTAATAAAATTDVGYRRFIPLGAAALVGVATVSGAYFSTPLAALAWPVGVALAVYAYRVAGHLEDAWPRWAARLQAVLFVEALTPFCFLRLVATDVFLHDTLFVSGTLHLAFFVGAVGWMAAARPQRVGGLGWLGFAGVAVGGQMLALSHLLVGSQGMPRRYSQYLSDRPFYRLMHETAAVAGVILVLGVIAVWLGTRRGDSNSSTR
ncbi:hypothetical protein ABI59_11205 [Acidobacteria bacterium Mor1]|nr:hypothetical protein ABI59_11205 [Acidobacteria bacterium Mor1]